MNAETRTTIITAVTIIVMIVIWLVLTLLLDSTHLPGVGPSTLPGGAA